MGRHGQRYDGHIQGSRCECVCVCSLDIGYCVTYDETSYSFINQFKVSDYNVTKTSEYIQLPTVLTELNDYICGTLNSLVCSECADGFSPSVTSLENRCANCTNAWYGVPLFLAVSGVCPNHTSLFHHLSLSNQCHFSSYALLHNVCSDNRHAILH